MCWSESPQFDPLHKNVRREFLDRQNPDTNFDGSQAIGTLNQRFTPHQAGLLDGTTVVAGAKSTLCVHHHDDVRVTTHYTVYPWLAQLSGVVRQHADENNVDPEKLEVYRTNANGDKSSRALDQNLTLDDHGLVNGAHLVVELSNSKQRKVKNSRSKVEALRRVEEQSGNGGEPRQGRTRPKKRAAKSLLVDKLRH